MPSFEKLFFQSKGQPVVYAGKTIQMVDRIPVNDGQCLRVRFESVNSDWRQGVYLTVDGGFTVNGVFMKKAVVLWHDTAPKEVLLQVQTKNNNCQIKNVWDIGDGVMHSWHNGGAMIVEETNSGKRYHCNDGLPDEDFDDLIFCVEVV